MPLIEWTHELTVSVEEIDKQHKKLVNLINMLHDSMRVGKGKEVLGKVLSELTDYTIYHFESEEKLLVEYAYPSYAIHKKEHENLTKQVKEIKSKFERGEPVITLEFMSFLKDWLSNHILQTDKRYSSFLNSKGIH